MQTEDYVGQCNQECERNQKPNELRIMGWSNGRPTMTDDHVQNSPNCDIAVKDRQRHHQNIPEYAVAKPAHDAEIWRAGPSRVARLKEIQSLSSSSRKSRPRAGLDTGGLPFDHAAQHAFEPVDHDFPPQALGRSAGAQTQARHRPESSVAPAEFARALPKTP